MTKKDLLLSAAVLAASLPADRRPTAYAAAAMPPAPSRSDAANLDGFGFHSLYLVTRRKGNGIRSRDRKESSNSKKRNRKL
jgi:hypothetical protein